MSQGVLSWRHGRVQRLRRMVRRKAHRAAEGAFVAEGVKVVAEALRAGAPLEGVYFSAGELEAPGVAEVVCQASEAGVRCFELGPGIMERVADAVTPQPVLAVIRNIDVLLDALYGADLLVICDGVKDPGNAGTVIRSSEAAGADGLVFCGESVDLYNPKTVRSSAGALFHLPIVLEQGAAPVLERLGTLGFTRIAAVAAGGSDYAGVDLSGRVAIVVGNEAHGLSAEVASIADRRVSIPMAGQAESLNVGVASAVLCFESARQRRLGFSEVR